MLVSCYNYSESKPLATHSIQTVTLQLTTVDLPLVCALCSLCDTMEQAMPASCLLPFCISQFLEVCPLFPRPPWCARQCSCGVHPRSTFRNPADIHSLPAPTSRQPLAVPQDDPETCRPQEPERGAFQAISLPLLSA